jgi:ribosomal protein L37AE/L43A
MTEEKPRCPNCQSSELCVRISQQWHCNGCGESFGFTVKATPFVERDGVRNGFVLFVGNDIKPPQKK